MSKNFKPKAKITVSAGNKENVLKKIADKAIADKKYQDKMTGKEYSNDTRRPERGPNDIKWRTSTRLTTSAANIPFGHPLGLSIPLVESAALNYPITVDGNSVAMHTPGVLAIALEITGGRCSNYNSPLNLAVRKSYSWIRHANSGSKNYENTDLGIYYLAVGQALALLGWLKRIYVHALNYSATNRYLPRDILTIDSINHRDIMDNLPNLLFLINWMSSAINSLAFPKFYFFDMCHEQFMHIYKDSESPKEQFYLFTPYTFGVYNPTYNSVGGAIEYTGLIPTSTTFAQLSTLAHTVMDVLLGDEDIGIISGDILKAYGEDRFKVEPVDVKAIAEPIYSIEVLEQIHNCTITGGCPVAAYAQNAGQPNTAPYLYEVFSPASPFTVASTDYFLPSGDKIIIDAFGRDPTPEEVVNCSVLKSHLEYTMTSSGTVTCVASQHDVLLPCSARIIPYSGSIAYQTVLLGGASSEWYFNLGSRIPTVDLIKMTNFDWHPMLVMYDDSSSNADVYGDVFNLTVCDTSQLARIHEASVLSLFNFESGNF